MKFNKNTDITHVLKNALKERQNPTDLKAIHIGKVVNLNPVTVSIQEGKILLEENDELFISEWFRFRCNIDKTNQLTTLFDADIANISAKQESILGFSEVHSFTSAPCNIPTLCADISSAFDFVKSAMTKERNELLALKCELQIGDLVAIGSLEQLDRYILLEKVLDDDYSFYDED